MKTMTQILITVACILSTSAAFADTLFATHLAGSQCAVQRSKGDDGKGWDTGTYGEKLAWHGLVRRRGHCRVATSSEVLRPGDISKVRLNVQDYTTDNLYARLCFLSRTGASRCGLQVSTGYSWWGTTWLTLLPPANVAQGDSVATIRFSIQPTQNVGTIERLQGWGRLGGAIYRYEVYKK